MGHVAIRAREASRYNTVIGSASSARALHWRLYYLYGLMHTEYTAWSTRGVSACYTLDHGIISLCLSQKVKGQKRSAARETHIPLLCSDEGVVE